MRKKTMSLCAALLVCCMLAGCSGEELPAARNTSSEPLSSADQQDDSNYISQLTAANDFYGYINAEDLMKMELKVNQSAVGTFILIGEETRDQVNEIIKEIAESDKDYAPGSNEQLIHDLYWQIYNTVTSEKKNSEKEDTELIESYINKIESVSTTEELISMWHDFAADTGIPMLYYPSVLNNINDSREKDMYFSFITLANLDEIKNSSITATQTRDEFSSYLRLLGVSADEAKERAANIIYLYYEIAGYSDPILLSGDYQYYEHYNILTREECSSKLKNLTYEQLLKAVGYDGKLPDKIVTNDPGQLVGVDSLINSEHLRVWKDISLITMLRNYSALLPSEYTFVGFDASLAETNALNYVRKILDRQVSEIYGERYFNEKKGEIIAKMCNDMVGEYYKLISGADWLSNEGKAFLAQKLDNMKFFIGTDAPHETDPADAELIGSTLLKTAYNYERIELQKHYDELFSGKPFNGFDNMSPSTVNACYITTENSIVITAAVLNKRMFDEDADYAWNLGSIGSIIGHEISHAFDSDGVEFDAYGNYRPEAMPKEDIKAFKEIQDKAIAYYSTFRILGSPVDGKLTLGENLADISGLQCALSIAGYPENQKKVFESNANMRKMLMTDLMAKEYLGTDVHSPEAVRVNAVVALFDEFYEIYGVKEGDPMYVAPEDRIRRW